MQRERKREMRGIYCSRQDSLNPPPPSLLFIIQFAFPSLSLPLRLQYISFVNVIRTCPSFSKYLLLPKNKPRFALLHSSSCEYTLLQEKKRRKKWRNNWMRRFESASNYNCIFWNTKCIITTLILCLIHQSGCNIALAYRIPNWKQDRRLFFLYKL